MQLEDQVKQLQQELLRLRTQQADQTQEIALQLNSFSDKLDLLAQQVQASSTISTKHISTEQNENALATQAQQQTGEALTQEHHPAQIPAAEEVKVTETEDSAWQSATSSKSPKKTTSAWFDAQLAQLVGFIKLLLSPLLGHFGELITKASGFYRHYQAKGLGPVFLMTLAGIIAFTLGFGYLLQYSINHWLSDLGKVLLGLTAANTTIAVGIFIHHKRSGMKEFGSSIVGLGLILNYLCLYFIGPYFNLISTDFCFGLLLINTLLGYGLSFKLDTKIVAVLALLGGSLSPFMTFDSTAATSFYIPYLFIVAAASLVQTSKLRWPPLLEIAAVIHIICLELITHYLVLPFNDLNWQTITVTLIANGFFYLYTLGCLYLIGRSMLPRRLLFIPVIFMIATLYNLYQLSSYAGEIFATNALICAVLYAFSKQRTPFKPLLLLFGASFAGLAAVLLFQPSLFAQIILLEALLLLWLGTKENYLSVRTEAYVLLLIGVLTNVVQVFDKLLGHFSSHHLELSISALLSCLAIYLSISLLSKSAKRLKPAEVRLIHWLKEGLSLLIIPAFLLITSLISTQYFLNMLPLLSVGLLYLSQKDKLTLTEILAWLSLLPLVAMIAFGILDSGSLSFSDQTRTVKLARIELFAALILAYYWYKKYYQQGVLTKLAYYIQLACYLSLPLLFIPKVTRSYPEYLAIALWCSSVISVGLAKFVTHRALKFESQLITVLAILMTANYCLANLWQGLVALLIGAIVIGIIWLRYSQLNCLWRSLLGLQWSITPYYIALCLAVVTQSIAQIFTTQWQALWAITSLTLCGYFALLSQGKNSVSKLMRACLKASFSCAYYLTYLFAVAPLMLLPSSLAQSTNVLILCLCQGGALLLLALMMKTSHLGVTSHKKWLPKISLIWAWNIMLTLSYLSWSYQLAISFGAPISSILLVIHACVLMFISLQPKQTNIIRLASILFSLACLKILILDMASFGLVQKVVAFMVIGGLLLSVAYFYQKRKNQLATQCV